MRAVFIIFFCVAASATAAPAGVEGTDAKTPSQTAKVLAYASYLDSLDKSDVNSVSKAADYFQEKLMQASEPECIAAAVHFDAFFRSLEVTQDQEHRKEWENIAAEAFQKAHGEEYLKNGLALQWCDSGLGCFVSPDAPQTVFKPFTLCAAPQVRAYFTLPSGTHGDPGYMSGSFSEVATDVGEHELFLVEFPDSAFSEKVTARRDRMRVQLFLGGPFLFEPFESHGTVSPEALAAYRWYIEKYPKTETADLLRRYCAILEENGLKFCRPVYDFLKQQTPGSVSDRLRWDFDLMQQYFASSDENLNISGYVKEHEPK
ncbi:MAG: hypothetical protein WC655_09595 [Candidatus Hydrogenedentales bacterium]|jgi:hypothetical protein